MKLYLVPDNSIIRVINNIDIPPAAPEIVRGEELRFFHIDGMYSLCKNQKGEFCHLVAWANVKYVRPITNQL